MGVLVYADDKIYDDKSSENRFFNKINKVHPVLGVESLEKVKASTSSIGSYSALILDWDFGEDEAARIDLGDGADGVTLPKRSLENETFDFLMYSHFYSLIYIFSENDIENSDEGEKLIQKFGNRIKFIKKDKFGTDEEITETSSEILKEIENWRVFNKNLSFPIKWGQTINQGIQVVFDDLASADEDWISELYKSVESDGLDPKVFVVELFQMILSEQILTDNAFLELLEQQVSETQKTEVPESKPASKGNSKAEKVDIATESPIDKTKESKLAKLFSRIHYSTLLDDSPIMTGDVCDLTDGTYGIIISPECDICTICSVPGYYFDMLVFNPSNFNTVFQSQAKNYVQAEYDGLKETKKKGLRGFWNAGKLVKFHLLPSLPEPKLKERVIIDFTKSAMKYRNDYVVQLNRPFKLNSPFIQQLRQRYLSYIGRVGVPALPNSVRDWNLG